MPGRQYLNPKLFSLFYNLAVILLFPLIAFLISKFMKYKLETKDLFSIALLPSLVAFVLCISEFLGLYETAFSILIDQLLYLPVGLFIGFSLIYLVFNFSKKLSQILIPSIIIYLTAIFLYELAIFQLHIRFDYDLLVIIFLDFINRIKLLLFFIAILYCSKNLDLLKTKSKFLLLVLIFYAAYLFHGTVPWALTEILVLNAVLIIGLYLLSKPEYEKYFYSILKF